MGKYSYKKAGVDVKRGDEFSSFIYNKLKFPSWVYKDPTGYATILYFTNPPIVVTADGIGSKLILHAKHQTWREAAYDLVAMNYNDILAVGGRPRAFVDYLGVSEISDAHKHFINALVDVLRTLDMELVAGETAELPDLYDEYHWDVAGFCIGTLEKKLPIDTIKLGDVIIGLKANGFHSNGWSLLRQIIKEEDIEINSLHFFFLKGTKVYSSVLNYLDVVKGIAHVTGGGINRALSRLLRGYGYSISLPRRDYIDWVLKYVDIQEAYSTFNMGIGMIMVVDPSNAEKITASLPDALVIGRVSNDRKITYENN